MNPVPGSEQHSGAAARIKNGRRGGRARELLARYESKVRLVVRRQLPRLLRSRFDSLDFLQSVGEALLQDPDRPQRLWKRSKT